MPPCPRCSFPIQTLALPCPACDDQCPELDRADSAVHEYSKTFHTKWAFRPEPDRFVATLNHWLEDEPGLLAVSPLLHPALEGVGAVTLLCTASREQVPHVFRFHRLALMKGALLGRPVTDLGSALNDWKERHPDADLAWFEVLHAPNGRPAEVWLLCTMDRHLAPPITVPPPRSGFMGVQRIPVAVLFPIFLLILAAGLTDVGETGLLNVTVFGAVTAALGWSFFRFPIWRRGGTERRM